MIRKKIAEIRAKRKQAKEELKKLMEKLKPLVEKKLLPAIKTAAKIYIAKKYGIII